MMENSMTMIPPKIKKLPGLRVPQSGYIENNKKSSGVSNKSMPYSGVKMVR